MKKTITILALVMITGACILFACKKMQSPVENTLSAKSSNLRANALTCTFVDLTGTLSTQTLVNTNIYRINGIVRIPSGVTVTVPAGTIFYGVKSSTATAWLVIEKGGKLIATGTALNPIVFTSDQAPGSRAPGDWGGIAFAGNANNNNSNSLSIDLSSFYTLTGGGTTNSDNSGNLQYVQLLFAGHGYTGDDRSRTGLLINSIGTGTTIDHVQVTNSLSDGIANYGGVVKESFMISYNAGRTDFPISYGYQGNMQFLAAMRMNNAAVPSTGAYALDLTNQALTLSSNTPLTRPVISNVTVLGPNYCSSSTVNNNFKQAVHFDLNGAGKIYNSVFSSWNSAVTPSGLMINSTNLTTNSIAKTASNDLEFSYNSFDNSGVTPYAAIPFMTWSGDGGCSANIGTWITAGLPACREAGNQFSVATLGYDGSFCSDYCASGFSQNFVLGSTTLSAPVYTWDSGSAFSHVTYRGSFGSTDFTSGWTQWCPQNIAYCN